MNQHTYSGSPNTGLRKRVHGGPRVDKIVRHSLAAGVCAVALLCASDGRAQWAVICGNCTNEFTEIAREAARVQAVLQQIRTLEAELQQMRQVYASVAHLPDQVLSELGQTLNVPQLRNPLPSAGAALSTLTTAGGLNSLGQRYLDQNRIFAPAGGGFAAGSMAGNASSIAGVQAMADQLFQSVSSHIEALQGLETLITQAPDAKAVADITARVQTEQTYLAAQQVQAQAISAMQGAQVRASEQQRRESRRCYVEAALRDLDSGSQESAGPDSCAQPASAAGTGVGSAGAGSAGQGGAATGNTGAMIATGYDQYLGQSVGSGQCVALVQAADSDVGLTRTWTQGAAVMGNSSLQPGTAIATFNGSGHYANATDGSSHAAIYLGQNAQGIQVMDQWAGHAASSRTIPWSNTSGSANTGSAFYVISH